MTAALRCPACDGQGRVIEKRFTKIYPTGYYTVAVPCVSCHATGRATPTFDDDAKVLAAGGIQ